MQSNARVEPVVLLLFVGMLFFTGVLLFTAWIWPSDGQVFQVIAGILTAFSGAFFMRIKPRSLDPQQPTEVASMEPK